MASAIPEDLDKIKESGLSLIQHFSKIEEKVKYRLLFKKAYNWRIVDNLPSINELSLTWVRLKDFSKFCRRPQGPYSGKCKLDCSVSPIAANASDQICFSLIAMKAKIYPLPFISTAF